MYVCQGSRTVAASWGGGNGATPPTLLLPILRKGKKEGKAVLHGNIVYKQIKKIETVSIQIPTLVTTPHKLPLPLLPPYQ